MKTLAIFWSLLVTSAALAAEPVAVVTTTADIAAIVKAIGGERVAVESIAKGYQDPHFVEAKPSFIRLVNRARMLFNVGLELEAGWLPLLIQGGTQSVPRCRRTLARNLRPRKTVRADLAGSGRRSFSG